ncbi:hypothetical protein O181_075018 [Austropuccinia psidii MF-1]|uniref:Uncharacterized protein n=1 Tax=Austropuccinia psidii MF-1 TaxID=1389203 RepID=A0A9Q3FC68_9BASI|nr:hypothetical protein [Austropuccinia psidii MF-1]
MVNCLNSYCLSRSPIRLTKQTHNVTNYFISTKIDTCQGGSYEICTYIQKAINSDLNNSSEEEDEARQTYQLLHRKFDKNSWLHVMNLFNNLVNGSDAAENLNKVYASTQSTVRNRVLVAICFYYRNKKFYHKISIAMDAKLSLDEKSQIRSTDIFQVAQCFQKRNITSSPSTPSSIMEAINSIHPQFKSHSRARFAPEKSVATAKQIPLSLQAKSWEKYHLSPLFPFLHCYYWGHCVQYH